MTDPHFFGYGSLVNARTHDYAPVTTARLDGWQRVWRHTSNHPFAFLTVEPNPKVSIDGVLAPVPNADWTGLDIRERAYDRQLLGAEVHHESAAHEISVYWVPDGKHPHPDTPNPILLSYLDAVVQGYLTLFGEAGVTDFFETTQGWSAPILNDRPDPRYPRSVHLTAQQTALVDDALSRLPAMMEKL